MLPLVALYTLLAPLAMAVPCVQFDSNWNLYAFGGSEDVGLGPSSSWGSSNVTTLTSSGRPPWTGTNTQCLLSQYNNAMYVVGGDASDLSKVYIYNFASDSWSTQTTSSPPPDYGNSRSATVLDHDTNVFFTLTTNSGLYQLDFGTPDITTTASGSAVEWTAVTNPSFNASGYTAVAAQASNHIHYFGVPGTPAGSADIFIVHFSLFQEQPQSYPTVNGGKTFPDSEGQAVSIPSSTESGNPPYQMIYIPNDFSQTYVVTHWTDPGNYLRTDDSPLPLSLVNTTQLLPAPSSADSQAAYAASPSSLAQVDSNGNIYYISDAVNNWEAQSSSSWQKHSYTLQGVSGGSSSTSASGSSSSTASMSQASGASGSASSGSAQTSAASASGSAQSDGTSARPSGAATSTVGDIRWAAAAIPAGLVALGAALVL